MSNERLIKVTGTGVVNLKPDMTRLSITVRGTDKEYSDALRRSAEDTGRLRAALEPLGFAGDKLKTVSFGVDARYEGYNDKNGNWRQRFMGYEYVHMLKLEFDLDNELLGRLLYSLAHSGVTPEFGIGYTVKDKEAAKDPLIVKAVQDAKHKAGVLAEASGVSLAQIISIDYSFGDQAFEVRPMARGGFKACMNADCAEEEAAYGMDIVPEDIRVTDTVTVVWEIK